MNPGFACAMRLLGRLRWTYLGQSLEKHTERKKHKLLVQNGSFWGFLLGFTWRGRGLSKSFISRLIIGVTPFRVLIALLITYLLSPLPFK